LLSAFDHSALFFYFLIKFKISVKPYRVGLSDFLAYTFAERNEGVKAFLQNCVKKYPMVIDIIYYILKRVHDFPWHIPKNNIYNSSH